MKILIVDDNKEITELLKIYTNNEGYESITAYDGQEALDQFAAHPDTDLIILDVMMPKKDGIEVVKEIRIDSQVPILMLSAKVSDTDKIKGLVNGADDYVTKPFNPLEVMARVKSLLRRSQHYNENLTDTKEINVGPLVIDKEGHTVKTDRGEYIQLTALEFGILHLLASHPSRVFSADEIFERVWKQDSVVSSKTVMVHVSHLRDKIAQATDGEQVVETVWGVGYKINSDMIN